MHYSSCADTPENCAGALQSSTEMMLLQVLRFCLVAVYIRVTAGEKLWCWNAEMRETSLARNMDSVVLDTRLTPELQFL